MKLEQRSGLTQLQKLALTPEIRQSLAILQLPLPELQSYLARQLTENCCLELGAEEPTEIDAGSDVADPSMPESWETMLNLDEPDWDNGYQYNAPSATQPRDPNQPNASASGLTGYPDLNLHQYLLFQLHLTSLNPAVQRIVVFLIENINPDGYLDCAIDEAALVLKVDRKEAEQALQLLQTFEPVGVGARSAGECLTLQLQALKKTAGNAVNENLNDLALRIVTDHLNAVAEGRLAQIAAGAGKTMAEVNEAVTLIKRLDPKPGRNFTDDPRPAAILPDASVKKAGPGYVVEVLEAAPDRLRVSPFYRQLLAQRDSLDAETINFLRVNYQAALGLIKSLAQRQATLYKISAAIVEAQQEFLAKGERCLKPLTLRQIAAVVGLNQSTVSRAVSGKYLETPRGMYAFKYFFCSGLGPARGGIVSAVSAKKLIQTTIQAEDPARPLSDEDLVRAMQDQGVEISRRTVTKYREAMGIPDSRARRLH